MNLTPEQYLSGLEKLFKNLPRVLADWNNIEVDLQAEYFDQLEWMMQKETILEFIGIAGDQKKYLLQSQIVDAVSEIYTLKDLIFKTMNLTLR